MSNIAATILQIIMMQFYKDWHFNLKIVLYYGKLITIIA